LGHREHQGHVLNALGGIAGYQGKYNQAETAFQEALALARQIGHRAQICRILSNLGELTILQGDCAQAECYLQEGLELARQLGSQTDLPYLLMNLGNAVGQQGDYNRANAYLQESVELARRQGALWDLGFTLATWGEIHLQYQQVEAATSAFDEVLALNNDAERDPHLLARAQYGLAQILALRGEISEARRLGQESLVTLEALKHFKAGEVRQWLHSL
jgi:tetratricopeptide (TPR) repeat protein